MATRLEVSLSDLVTMVRMSLDRIDRKVTS